MLIPLTSDAELKYWPIATWSFMVVHLLVFSIQTSVPSKWTTDDTGQKKIDGTAQIELVEVPGWYDLMLSHGDGMHPVQWLSSMMIHGSWLHLIGNMIFLWVFGHVVEGIVGSFSFVGLYLGLGMLQNIFEQLIFLGTPEIPSLGASGAIFSIMMLAALWNPQDNIQCLLILFFRPLFIQVPILMMGAMYFLWDFSFALLQGFSLSTEFLHVTGAAFGMVAGLVILARGKIDCDDRDILSMIAEARGKPKKTSRAAALDAPRGLTPIELEQRKSKLAFSWKTFDTCLDAGHADTAISQLNNVRKLDPGMTWDENRLLRLIQVLRSQRRFDDVLRYSEQYLALFSSRAEVVRLSVASIMVEKGLPRKSLSVLAALDLPKLDPKNRQVAENLRAHCNQLIADGTMEVRDD